VDGGIMMLSVLRASQLVAYGFGGGFEPGVYSTTGQELDKKLGFDYALVPHQGDWRDDCSYRQGLAFNNPLIVRKTTNHAGDLPASWGLLSVEPGNIVVSALKLSHEGTLVLRIYEAEGRQVNGAVIRFNALLESVQETNLLEEPLAAISHDQHQFTCDIGAFEIKTYQLHLSNWL
jgi:alpha-mannosidase